MDIISVSKQIHLKILELEKGREHIKEALKKRANAIGEYEKVLAQEVMRLKVDEKMPISIIDRVARGNCFQAKINMELADTNYKRMIKKMDTIGAEMMGYQTIYKHLDNK